LKTHGFKVWTQANNIFAVRCASWESNREGPTIIGVPRAKQYC